jgi:hypothetical protein
MGAPPVRDRGLREDEMSEEESRVWALLDERLAGIEGRLSQIEALLSARVPPDMAEVLADVLGIYSTNAQLVTAHHLMATHMQRLSSDLTFLDADVREVLHRVAERRREAAQASRTAHDTS